MEKPIEIVAIFLIGVVIIAAIAIFFSSKYRSNLLPSGELEKACLELMKVGCNENEVNIDRKSFEEVCKENGLDVKECKRHCGCEW